MELLKESVQALESGHPLPRPVAAVLCFGLAIIFLLFFCVTYFWGQEVCSVLT